MLFYHADLPGLAGGYVGVDIFFVISGFLIASLIQKDVNLGRFSLADFWMRRAKRIFPALATVMLVTTIACAALLIPDDFRIFGKSLVATAFFVANLHFGMHGGYFDAPAMEKPLLHTWSLSIEEQFYILFPLVFVFVLRRFPLRAILPATALFVASAACLAQMLVLLVPEQAFYLLPARIWELGLGVLVALAAPVSAIRERTALALSLAGFALVAFSITHAAQGSFPGIGALAPCAGAALLILGGTQPGPVQRLLSVRPLVFVGLISYSLYLWHWPILALPRYVLGRQLGGWETAAALAASAVLAVLTWKFIERPARAMRLGGGIPLRAIGLASIPLLVLAAAGTVIRLEEGFPWRLPADVGATYRQAKSFHPLQKDCRGADRPGDGERCNFGAKRAGDSFDMVIWGDSHAEAIAPAFWDLARQWGWSGRQFAHNGCIPLLDVLIWDRGIQAHCAEFTTKFDQFVASNKDLKLVVLASRWSRFGMPSPSHPDYSRNVELLDAAEPASRRFETQRLMGTALAKTVKRLTDAGIKVVIVGQAPEYFGSPLNCFTKHAVWAKNYQACGQAKADLLRYMAPSDRLIASVAATDHLAKAVLLTDGLCDDVRCKVEMNNVPLYRDHDHLSQMGARQLTGFFARQLRGFIEPAADPTAALGLAGERSTSKN